MNGGAKQNNALCPFMGEKVDANVKTEWGTELTWLLNLKKIEKILAIYV